MSESVRVALSDKARKSPVTAATLTPAQVESSCTCNAGASEEHSRHMEQLRSLPEVRAERIAAIKRMITDGTFDTDARLSEALDRMFDELRQH